MKLLSLAETLLSHAGPARERLAALPALESRLGDRLAEARAAWPRLTLADGPFLAHLAEKLAQEPDPGAALDTLLVPDLFLACACAAGDRSALEELEARYMPRAAGHFARNGSLARHAEELMQLVRMRLLVADGVARPRIAEYSGRAPFGAWFRVVVERFAMNYVTTHRLEPTTDAEARIASPAPDPELDYLRTHHGADLDASFRETLAHLPPRTGNLLRLFYLDGLSPRTIGGHYGVSDRTIRRWLERTRARILRETERRLGAKLSLSVSQVGSLIAVMRSTMDTSILRFFEPPRS